MCTTTSASDGEMICTRADPGPDVMRSTGHWAGTVIPTRPSTNSVIAGTAAGGAGGSCRVANPPHSTAPATSAPAITADARRRRIFGTASTAGTGASCRVDATATRRNSSSSATVTAIPLVRNRSAI